MAEPNQSTPTKMSIDITQLDIEQGKICSTEECIIAVSLKRLGYTNIEVMSNRLYINNKVYWFDPDLVDYVKNFDLRQSISPAQFTIYNIDDRNASPKLGRPKKDVI